MMSTSPEAFCEIEMPSSMGLPTLHLHPVHLSGVPPKGNVGMGVPHLTGLCCSGMGREKASGVQGLLVNLRQAELLPVTHASGVPR